MGYLIEIITCNKNELVLRTDNNPLSLFGQFIIGFIDRFYNAICRYFARKQCHQTHHH